MLRRMAAKFPGQCASSGKIINVGAMTYFDTEKKRMYLDGHEPKEIPPLRDGDPADKLLPERKKEWFDKIRNATGKPSVFEKGLFGNKRHLPCGCFVKEVHFEGINNTTHAQGRGKKYDIDTYTFCDQHKIVSDL